MERTKRDNNQIQQFEHDEITNAKRVRMVGTEMSIELDHADGDSVTAHPAKLVASITGVEESDAGTEILPPVDCSSLRAMRIDKFGTGTVTVYFSPVDSGDVWREGSEIETDLIARRVKIVCNDFVGDVHLVGRS